MAIKRQSIVDAIKTKYQTIKIANTYHTNVGNNVFVWRPGIIQAQDLPALNIRDYKEVKADEVTGGPASFDNWNLYFEVELVCTSGSLTHEEVRKIIADVYKATGDDIKWGGLATATFLEDDSILMDQKERTIGGAILNFYVLYRTNKFQES